jgi:hypothetical protein
MKHRKLKLALVSLLLAGTVLAMIADQAAGSCCGARESSNIEIGWWAAIAIEATLLVYIAKRISN